MNEAEVAAMRRKIAATQEPAKRNELANLLRVAGHDPDAVETVSEPSRAKSEPPVGRSTKPLVTAEPTKPVVEAEATVKAPAVKADVKPATSKRRTARPAAKDSK